MLMFDYGGGVHVPDYGNQMRVQKPKIFACGAIVYNFSVKQLDIFQGSENI